MRAPVSYLALTLSFALALPLLAQNEEAAATAEKPAPAPVLTKFKTIVIDPGHGGIDSGTQWYGVSEEDLTLDLALRVRKHLRKLGIENVILTRESDEGHSLLDRVKIAEKHPKPVLVSLHFDAMLDTSAHGSKVYISPHAYPQTFSLGAALSTELRKLAKPKCRGIKRNNFLLLRESKIPAVIVECGFMSNPAESKLIQRDGFREELAERLANGLLKYGTGEFHMTEESSAVGP